MLLVASKFMHGFRHGLFHVSEGFGHLLSQLKLVLEHARRSAVAGSSKQQLPSESGFQLVLMHRRAHMRGLCGWLWILVWDDSFEFCRHLLGNDAGHRPRYHVNPELPESPESRNMPHIIF